MPRIKKSDSDDTRTRLLEVGLKTFANRGYHGTGIKEIVDTAGVPKGSFYNYFKSKEDFGIEIIRRHSKEFWDTWDSCFDQGISDTIDALKACFEKMILEHVECAVYNCCIVGNLCAELSEHSAGCNITIASFLDHWRGNLARYIEMAQGEGIARTDLTPDELAFLFWDTWHGTLIRVRITSSVDPLRKNVSLVLDSVIRA